MCEDCLKELDEHTEREDKGGSKMTFDVSNPKTWPAPVGWWERAAALQDKAMDIANGFTALAYNIQVALERDSFEDFLAALEVYPKWR